MLCQKWAARGGQHCEMPRHRPDRTGCHFLTPMARGAEPAVTLRQMNLGHEVIVDYLLVHLSTGRAKRPRAVTSFRSDISRSLQARTDQRAFLCADCQWPGLMKTGPPRSALLAGSLPGQPLIACQDISAQCLRTPGISPGWPCDIAAR